MMHCYVPEDLIDVKLTSGSGKGLELSGNEPQPDPVLTLI